MPCVGPVAQALLEAGLTSGVSWLQPSQLPPSGQGQEPAQHPAALRGCTHRAEGSIPTDRAPEAAKPSRWGSQWRSCGKQATRRQRWIAAVPGEGAVCVCVGRAGVKWRPAQTAREAEFARAPSPRQRSMGDGRSNIAGWQLLPRALPQ